ncbi:MAG: DUF4062 domain-containing protein [Methylococcales bacterium]|nr:DUF4062 domain-containing protein [Methylococcales bacterium]
MTDTRKVVKVFLASPGDLAEERSAAKLVVDEINDLFAEEFGYQIELVGWEDTISVYGRPQATINRELERCELFVGLMYKKWGTPPDTKGTYSSGFEEEFEISVRRRANESRPEISLLFKKIDPGFLSDPGEDLKKVLAFKDKLNAEKKILYEEFATIQEFEKRIRRCILKYVKDLRNREAEEISVQSQSPKTDGEKQQATEKNNSALETPLSIEGANFLREFISKTERDVEKEPIAAVEVARFRLLASIVGNQGNDGASLGVHDANLLFAEGGDFTFGRSELIGLMSCGLEHYSDENTPLWRWFTAIGGFTRQILPIYSVIGTSTERKAGALAAMRLISEPIPSVPPDNREFYLGFWFAKDAASAVKVAALNYLGDCGLTADLPTINQELDRGDYQTTRAAADAIIRINLRDSREKAILSLYELQPTSISRKVLAALFDNDVALSTETLLNGVGHRNSEVRRIVVELLCNRRALPIETAEQLLTDNDAKVRYEALKSLVDNGLTFSDAEAKKVLIKQVQNTGFGLIGAARALDSGGETCWSHFQLQRLRSLADKELEATAVADWLFDSDPHFILAERQFKGRGEDLRRAVDDQYKEEFSKALHLMTERFGEHADLLDKTRSLEEFLRKSYTRKGLDVICRKAEPCDLGRVRLLLKSGFVDYSPADIEYLRKFGEWEDILLIIDSVKRHESGDNNLLLSASDEPKYRTAARAIYALGRTRLHEVLAMSAPSKLLSQLIVEISAKAFRNLSDVSITLLLQSEDDAVRKSAALKCVRSLTKGRVDKLLTEYVSGGQHRYYNVVHWLDFGVSTPRDRAVLAAEKVLNKD